MTSYTGEDIYCDVVLPRKVDIRVVKETDNVLAYHHTNPHWRTHIMVVSKKHVLSIIELAAESIDLAKELLDTVAEIAESVRRTEGGCTIFTTIGDNQRSKHLHIHIRNGEELS